MTLTLSAAAPSFQFWSITTLPARVLTYGWQPYTSIPISAHTSLSTEVIVSLPHLSIRLSVGYLLPLSLSQCTEIIEVQYARRRQLELPRFIRLLLAMSIHSVCIRLLVT